MGDGDAYDRAVLVEVLVYHQRTADTGCACGWGVLGASFAEHVADVYEESVIARAE
jgi:16S rRNA G1207 methylase RsmC